MYTEEQLASMSLPELKKELADKKKYFEEGKMKKPIPLTIFSGQVEGEINQLEIEIRKRTIDDILDSL